MLNTSYNGVDYTGDADKVSASGSGLNSFFTGLSASFDIDTANAGKMQNSNTTRTNNLA